MALSEPDMVAGELVAALAAAWNEHDMQQFASFFHDDAAFVNVAGAYMRGREQIEQGHAAAHAGPFRRSTLVSWLEDARSVSPGMIVAHVHSELRRRPDGRRGPAHARDIRHSAARAGVENHRCP